MNPKKLVRPLILVGSLAAAWGLAVLVARPAAEDPLAHPYVGVRGASREKASGVMVLVGEGGLARALRPGESVKSGDTLHFVARAERPRYFALAYREGGGRVMRAFPPESDDAGRVEPGRSLPIAVVVDSDPRPAVVTAYWSDRPFSLAPYLAKASPASAEAPPPVVDPSVEPVIIRLPKAQ